MRRLLGAILAFVVLTGSARAADQWSMSVVKDLTSETMPQYVYIQQKEMPSYCQGYFIFQSANPDTVKAVYAMLLASQLSGRMVNILTDSAAPCVAKAVHGLVMQ